jgi:hypothetical protein
VKCIHRLSAAARFSQSAHGLIPHGVSHFLDDVAHAYFPVDEKPRKTHAMRLLLGFLSSILSFFIVHDTFVRYEPRPAIDKLPRHPAKARGCFEAFGRIVLSLTSLPRAPASGYSDQSNAIVPVTKGAAALVLLKVRGLPVCAETSDILPRGHQPPSPDRVAQI